MPGTVKDRCAWFPGPVGIFVSPRARKAATVAACGATPCPLKARMSLLAAWYSMPTPSVAREYDAVGSITAAAKPMATAEQHAHARYRCQIMATGDDPMCAPHYRSASRSAYYFGMLLIVLSCHGGSPLAVLAVPPSLTPWYRPSAWGMQPEKDCRLPVSRHATGKLLVSHYRPETVMDGPYPKISAPTGVGSCCLSELVSRR